MLRRARVLVSPKALGAYAAAATAVAGGGYLWLNSGPTYPPTNKGHRSPPAPWTPPSRAEHLKRAELGLALQVLALVGAERQRQRAVLVSDADDWEYALAGGSSS